MVAVIVTVRKYVHIDVGRKTLECSIRVPDDFLTELYKFLCNDQWGQPV